MIFILSCFKYLRKCIVEPWLLEKKQKSSKQHNNREEHLLHQTPQTGPKMSPSFCGKSGVCLPTAADSWPRWTSHRPIQFVFIIFAPLTLLSPRLPSLFSNTLFKVISHLCTNRSWIHITVFHSAIECHWLRSFLA